MSPITIVTGFLGAGKTSLVNHMLREAHGLRIAVLVNDFGAINIDAELIEGSEGGVLSLQNGCICCSLSDGLLAAVANVIGRPNPPDHIVIETSGVSDPIEIVRALSDPELLRFAPLDGVIAVVDAETVVDLQGDSLELARRQIFAADLVLLNKLDLADAGMRQRTREWVRIHSATCRMLEVEYARASLEALIGCAEVAQPMMATHPGSNAHAAFRSVAFESTSPISVSRLNGLLGSLPSSVLRIKGILNLVEKPDNRCLLQATAKRARITVEGSWNGQPARSQVVFIVDRGAPSASGIERILEQSFRAL